MKDHIEERGVSIAKWDKVAGIYDIFVNIINGKTHRELKEIVT